MHPTETRTIAQLMYYPFWHLRDVYNSTTQSIVKCIGICNFTDKQLSLDYALS